MWADVVLNILQLVIGTTLAGICLCRLNILGRRHRLHVRLAYCVLLAASVAAALAPWMFSRPGVATMLLAMAMAIYFLLPTNRWGCTPPPDTLTRPGELW